MKLFKYLKLININLEEYLINRNNSIVKEYKLFIQKTNTPTILKDFFLNIKPYSTDKKLIRIGGNGDGGYLVPDDFEGVTTCFSPGIFNVTNFEHELAQNYGIKTFMADFSVDAPPTENEHFHFIKKFIGFDNRPDYLSLENWINEFADPTDKDLVLQMDIEGGEYDVLIDTSREVLKRFRILVIEFHDFHWIFSKMGFSLINACLMKLKQDFDIVHIHPNNYEPLVEYGDFKVTPYIEFTFLRKDRIIKKNTTKYFPHELDCKNVSDLEDIILPGCFFNSKKN